MSSSSSSNGHGRLSMRSFLNAVVRIGAASAHENRPAKSWNDWDDLRRELNRSRRYERPFAVVRIAWPPSDANGRHNGSARANPTSALRSLTPFVRSVDAVWTDGSDLYCLLPECDRALAERTVARIGAKLAALLPPGATIHVASFPEDGRTTGALRGSLHGQPIETALVPVEAPPAAGVSLVEGILARTVPSPLTPAEALPEVPQDGASLA